VPGSVAKLDSLAAKFVATNDNAERTKILEESRKWLLGEQDLKARKTPKYYLTVMEGIIAEANGEAPAATDAKEKPAAADKAKAGATAPAAATEDYVTAEIKRVNKMLDTKLTADKVQMFQKRLGVLYSFRKRVGK